MANYLSESLGQIVFVSVFVEMNRYWKLSALDVDDRWGLLEQAQIGREVLDSQGSAHDDQFQRVPFLPKPDSVTKVKIGKDLSGWLTLFRSGTILDKRPMRMSVKTLRSWASSMMMAL